MGAVTELEGGTQPLCPSVGSALPTEGFVSRKVNPREIRLHKLLDTTLPPELSGAAAMEQLIVEWSQAGQLEEEIAEQLQERGFRSPMGTTVLPSTVKAIRLRHK